MKFLKMTEQQKNKILYHHVLLSSKKKHLLMPSCLKKTYKKKTYRFLNVFS